MTRESLCFGLLMPRSGSRLLVAVVLLLGIPFLVTKICAEEKPQVPSFTPDPRLAEIIREVKQNEALYENLETEQRLVKQLVLKQNAAWSPFGPILARREEKLHTVRQGDLIYYRGDEKELLISGDVAHFVRVSAFDGETTRSVDYGACVNIHGERHESQYVYPPHCWALFDQRVNFPLSVLLQGTEAIHKHPKTHVYSEERGSVFEFNRFEAEYAGEEEVNGLKCVKILCRRWYYTIRNGKPSKSFIWLAPERNYLCVKRQPIPREAKQPPGSFTIVDSFREIADGVWLPERVRVLDYYYKDLKQGKQTVEWKDTLELVEAKLNPGRPVGFFSDVEIPKDLPVYHIVDGRLAGQKFRDRQPTADSEERVREIIDRIRAEEEKYKNLEVISETVHHNLSRGFIDTRQFAPTSYTKETEHSIQSDGRRWYERASASRGSDSSASNNRAEAAFDGVWTRTFDAYSRIRDGKSSESRYASLLRGNETEVHVHLPHMLVQRYDWQTTSFSKYLASPLISDHPLSPHRIEYLGEDRRDGLRCAVLREAYLNSETREISSDRLIWLAVERNYLPLRLEYYRTPPQVTPLPAHIYTVGDWREIAPGLWYPFQIELRQMCEKGGQVNIAIGRMLVDHSTTYTASEVILDPVVDDGLFDGPDVSPGTKVSIQSETGISLGNYEQLKTGRFDLSEEEYVDLLNAANDLARADERRKKAMDALIGKPAPEIPASKWLNGTPKTWDDLKGKVIVLHFWASWCEPCRPDLEQLAEWYASQSNESKAELAIIGVHATGSKPAGIEQAIQEYGVKYPVFIDPRPRDDGWGELFNAFQVHAMPQTFVVDADGKIAAHGDLVEMLAKAEKLVREERQGKESNEKPLEE